MHEVLRTNTLSNLEKELRDTKAQCDEIPLLERSLKSESFDLSCRARLLGILFRESPKRLQLNGFTKPHVCWFIKNCASHAISVSCTESIDPLDDLNSFTELKNLWREIVQKNVSNFDVIFNAANFFEQSGYFRDALHIMSYAKKLRPGDRIILNKLRLLKSIVKTADNFKNPNLFYEALDWQFLEQIKNA